MQANPIRIVVNNPLVCSETRRVTFVNNTLIPINLIIHNKTNTILLCTVSPKDNNSNEDMYVNTTDRSVNNYF